MPLTDLFQRVLELDTEDFRFHPTYPDATAARTDDFVLIEVVLSAGRSVKMRLTAGAARVRLRPRELADGLSSLSGMR